MKLTKTNLILYAAQNYYNPSCIDGDEFFSDLKRLKYIKRLLNKYRNSGEISERLILNHLIVLNNVFGSEATVEMLALKIELESWSALKPFLIFLRIIKNVEITGIAMDRHVIEKLREIKWES
jgi:hypothetical protein